MYSTSSVIVSVDSPALVLSSFIVCVYFQLTAFRVAQCQQNLVLIYRNGLCCCHIQYTHILENSIQFLLLLFTRKFEIVASTLGFFLLSADYNTILMTIIFSCSITTNEQLGHIRQWKKGKGFRIAFFNLLLQRIASIQRLGSESSREK